MITSADAAAFLTDPARVRFLLPFLGHERTLSAVAGELGVPVSTVLYRTRQMLALKLLVVSRVVPRPGRAILHYRSAAEAFFVPFEQMPFETVEAQIRGLERRSQEVFTRTLARTLQERRAAQSWGTHLYTDPQGNPTLTAGPPPGQEATAPPPEPSMFSTWSTLRLTPEEARDLSRQLQALRDMVTNRASTGTDHYVVHLGFAGVVGTDDL